MTKRKRPINEPSVVDEESASQLTPFQIVRGLTHFWAPGSRTCFNYVLETLRSVERKPAEPIPIKQRTYKRLAAYRRKYRDLRKICQIEEFYNKLGSQKIDYTIGIPVNVAPNKDMSKLQQRHFQFLARDSPSGLSTLDANLKRYFLFVSMAEHESQQGSLDDNYELSMVDGVYWTPAEKRRFFDAVERCSRGDVIEISRRVGPTKTTAQVAAYLNLLDEAAKGLKGEIVPYDDERYSAREMSPLFMVQETRMSTLLMDTLETESHAKHQQLLASNHEKVTKALDMFEVWNMSSLSRLFAGTNDLTILCSTLVQYHELLENFIKEILGLVYTELLSSGHTIVDRTVINHIIAKRQKTMTENPDVRLKNLDIIAMLDKRKRYHKIFSDHRSVSFLAKRRRRGWANDKVSDKATEETSDEQEVIHVSSDSETESQWDDFDSETEWGSDQDEMLEPFDSEDELYDDYYGVDDGTSLPSEDQEQGSGLGEFQSKGQRSLHEEEIASGKENQETQTSRFEEAEESNEEIDLDEDEIDLDEEDEYDSDSSDDELVEARMIKLDSIYEQELMKGLGFYTKQDILDYDQTKKKHKD